MTKNDSTPATPPASPTSAKRKRSANSLSESEHEPGSSPAQPKQPPKSKPKLSHNSTNTATKGKGKQKAQTSPAPAPTQPSIAARPPTVPLPLVPVQPNFLPRPNYLEPQEQLFCGQHALNHLAQGPLFTRAQLDAHALRLTQLHRQEHGRAAAAQAYYTPGEGMYHSQVLEASLLDFGLTTRFWGDELMAAARANPHTAAGFILNRAQHWWVARPFGGQWYILDSRRAPRQVTHAELRTELAEVARARGGVVQFVEGNVDELTARGQAAQAHAHAQEQQNGGTTTTTVKKKVKKNKVTKTTTTTVTSTSLPSALPTSLPTAPAFTTRTPSPPPPRPAAVIWAQAQLENLPSMAPSTDPLDFFPKVPVTKKSAVFTADSLRELSEQELEDLEESVQVQLAQLQAEKDERALAQAEMDDWLTEPDASPPLVSPRYAAGVYRQSGQPKFLGGLRRRTKHLVMRIRLREITRDARRLLLTRFTFQQYAQIDLHTFLGYFHAREDQTKFGPGRNSKGGLARRQRFWYLHHTLLPHLQRLNAPMILVLLEPTCLGTHFNSVKKLYLDQLVAGSWVVVGNQRGKVAGARWMRVEDVRFGWDIYVRTKKVSGIATRDVQWFIRRVVAAGGVRRRQARAAKAAGGAGRNQAKRKCVRK